MLFQSCEQRVTVPREPSIAVDVRRRFARRLI
jgi:hypothetical protein